MAKDNKETEALQESIANLEADLQQRIDENDLLKQKNDQLNADIGRLQTKIAAMEAAARAAAPVKAQAGFVLLPGDPFAAGVMRTYRRLCPGDPQPEFLPFVIPYAAKEAGKKAVENYRLRAVSGGRKDLADEAEKHLSKY